jgi:hypothetical protein
MRPTLVTFAALLLAAPPGRPATAGEPARPLLLTPGPPRVRFVIETDARIVSVSHGAFRSLQPAQEGGDAGRRLTAG